MYSSARTACLWGVRYKGPDSSFDRIDISTPSRRGKRACLTFEQHELTVVKR